MTLLTTPKPSRNALAMTYKLAGEADYEPMMVRTSESGEPINLFTSLLRSTQDLVDKVHALRLLGQTTGTCFQRCVGWDALNALSIVTHEVDQAKQTNYHQRFKDYLRYVQSNDLVCNGSMTDVKGDRSKCPIEQDDTD